MSEDEINAMLDELDSEAKEYLSQDECLPLSPTGRLRLRKIVNKYLADIPLPPVPTDATCGGCRWHYGSCCYVDPVVANRDMQSPACRHYQEKPK